MCSTTGSQQVRAVMKGSDVSSIHERLMATCGDENASLSLYWGGYILRLQVVPHASHQGAVYLARALCGKTHGREISCRGRDRRVPRHMSLWWKPSFLLYSIISSAQASGGQIADHRLRLKLVSQETRVRFPMLQGPPPSLSVKTPAGCFPSGWRMTLYSIVLWKEPIWLRCP